MALLWNLFAAGPVSRLAFRKLFSHVGMHDQASDPAMGAGLAADGSRLAPEYVEAESRD
jgi:hypothetical protein